MRKDPCSFQQNNAAAVLSHVWLFATLWTVPCQAPLFVGFPRQEHWSGLPVSGERKYCECLNLQELPNDYWLGFLVMVPGEYKWRHLRINIFELLKTTPLYSNSSIYPSTRHPGNNHYVSNMCHALCQALGVQWWAKQPYSLTLWIKMEADIKQTLSQRSVDMCYEEMRYVLWRNSKWCYESNKQWEKQNFLRNGICNSMKNT